MAIDLIVIGAGGFGREALDTVEAHNRGGSSEAFNVLGVIDDSPSAANLERLQRRGLRHLGGFDALLRLNTKPRYLIGVGSPQARALLAWRCDEHDFVAATVIHPSAGIGSDTRIAEGVVICAGVQVSTNVDLEKHVHLNPNATVGHDTRLQSFVSVNPGAIVSGDVTIGERALIGAGATVLQGLTVGADATVGASSCVVTSVEPGLTVKGVPARSHLR